MTLLNEHVACGYLMQWMHCGPYLMQWVSLLHYMDRESKAASVMSNCRLV